MPQSFSGSRSGTREFGARETAFVVDALGLEETSLTLRAKLLGALLAGDNRSRYCDLQTDEIEDGSRGRQSKCRGEKALCVAIQKRDAN